MYSDLDLLVLTSLKEGTPFAIIEALATGIGVTPMDVEGVRDVIHSGLNGLLVRSGDTCAGSDGKGIC